MRPSVFVVGPQGSGKSLHAERIQQALGLDTVIDEWVNGQRWPTHGALILSLERPEHAEACEVLTIDEAVAISTTAHLVEVVPFHSAAPALPVAVGILQSASDAIGDRAASRDCQGGERSMGRCVRAFNAITGHSLTEVDGWHFMELLKLARATAGRYHADDHVDRAAYAALAGEAAAREAMHA